MSKVLLVEDEESIAFIYKRQLDLGGLPTDIATKGKDGLLALEKSQYNLILLDIMLPDMNGLDVLKEIKNNEKTKDVPVVLLTNLGQDSIIKEGFNIGASGYLLKAALTPDQIVQEAQEILKTKQTPETPLPVSKPS